MARPGAVVAALAKAGGRAPVPRSGWGTVAPVTPELYAPNSYRSAYAFLPRLPQTFSNAAFGPMPPIQPIPVDEAPPGARFPDPRWWQYRVGWNLPTPPGTEGLKLASFDQLRTLAQKYSTARACIMLREQEIRGLEWDITLTTDAAKAYRNDRAAMRDFGERKAKLRRFFRCPDPDFWTFDAFLNALLEEIFVYDALCLVFRPKYGASFGMGNRGVLGSDLDSLRLVSGPTIRPLVDILGGKPTPPNPAYQQYLYGVPRSDFQTIMRGDDIDDYGLTGAQVNEFRADRMLYAPYWGFRESPYGFPPVEQALLPIISGLQKQEFQLDYFTEGTVPAVYISPGDTSISPAQIGELQNALNGIAGDPAYHQKVIVLPPNSKVDPQRPVDLSDSFDLLVQTQVCCVPGTEIVTKRGLVKIEDILMGDEVLTHRGRWRKVLAKIASPVHTPVRRIEANGFAPLEVTGNHKLWAAQYGQTASHKQQYRQTEWVPAADIKPKRARGDFDAVTLPVPVMGNSDARLRLADILRDVHEENNRLIREGTVAKWLPSVVPLDAAFGRLLGFYMAEGSTGNRQVQWTFHGNEIAYQQQVLDDLHAVFGLDAKINPVAGENCVQVRCNSVLLAELLSCGIATTKKLPEWAWDGSAGFYSSLLWAWVAGDGDLTPNGWRGRTASKDLAWQMRLVALACGYEPQLRVNQQPHSVIKGRELKRGWIYTVGVVLNKEERRGTYRTDGPCLTSPVRKNELSAYDGNVVYNLNVQEDHSYVTSGGTCANCMAFDVQPIEIGLMPNIGGAQGAGGGPSSSAVRFAGQEKRDIKSRTSTKPLLKFLCSIFNIVIQDICDCPDMQFEFEGLVDDEDKQAITELGVEQIQNGVASIDEVRERLDLPPWGLQETSEPIVMTQAGPVPFSMAPQLLQAQLNGGASDNSKLPAPRRGTAPAKPNGSHPAPAAPGRPDMTPAHEAASASLSRPQPGRTGGTPSRSPVAGSRKRGEGVRPTQGRLRNAKAAGFELEALKRHLRKGREITTWDPVNIDNRVLAMVAEDVAKGVLIDVAVDRAGGFLFTDLDKSENKDYFPGWQQDLSLVDNFREKISQAFQDAEIKCAAIRKDAARGTIYLSPGIMNGVIADETKDIFLDVLIPMWEQAWDLGYDSAKQLANETALRSGSSPVINAMSLDPRLEARRVFAAAEGMHWLDEITRTGLGNSGARSMLIARTEVARAVNAGAGQHYRDSGVSHKHLLIAPGDACEICEKAAEDGISLLTPRIQWASPHSIPVPLRERALPGIDAIPPLAVKVGKTRPGWHS